MPTSPRAAPTVLLQLAARGVIDAYIGVTGSGDQDLVSGGGRVVVPAAVAGDVADALVVVADAVAAYRLPLRAQVVHGGRVRIDGTGVYRGVYDVFDPVRVPAWLAGFVTAHEHPEGDAAPLAGDDVGADLAVALTAPGLADQARLRLRAAMAAQQVTVVDLAARLGRSEKTVWQALALGRWLSLRMADQMAAELGVRWVLLAAEPVSAPAPTSPQRRLPGMTEPPAWSALRALFEARARGWLGYLGPADPHEALIARSVQVRLGEVHTVAMADLADWVWGVEAWYGRDR